MRLRIDAGHGGKDTGAAHGGYLEKDLTLILAKRVRVLLQDFHPTMTRTYDADLIWSTRAGIVRNAGDDICLSLHLNAAGGGARGVECIHSIYSTRGKDIATAIMEEIHKTGIPKRPRPVYSRKNSSGGDYYYMHRLTGSTTTVIVEALFLDSDLDKLFLNMEKLAQSIAQGFRNWVKGKGIDTKQDNPRTIRKHGSYVHIFETDKNMHVDTDLGNRGELETVGSIVSKRLLQGQKILAGINAGFFNFDGSREHLGEYISKGLYYHESSDNFVEMAYYKDGHTEITNRHGYDREVLSNLQATTHWSIGTSYCLVKDGKINLMNADKFSHATEKHPRTMIGQKVDGNFILVVADGRSDISTGLTATEQANIMLDLGCINAVNLDGGGSSTMISVEDGKPKLFNKPAYYQQRKVGSVILVKEV